MKACWSSQEVLKKCKGVLKWKTLATTALRDELENNQPFCSFKDYTVIKHPETPLRQNPVFTWITASAEPSNTLIYLLNG